MIVILTDFGNSEYVGVMKGVVYSIAPHEKIIDLAHDISPQNIIEGSWILKNNYKYFSKRSIFCCVVDPGVGTKRAAIMVKTTNYYFIAPDNGLLWETLQEQIIHSVIKLRIPKKASKTFHGRDIFAKAAARLSIRNFFNQGKKIKNIRKLEFYRKGRNGIVTRIDNFGNIITNLEKTKKKSYLVEVNNQQRLLSLYQTYDEAKEGQLFLIEGSCNTLEISKKFGNANRGLELKIGQKIKIK